jgi:hypothetical protein
MHSPGLDEFDIYLMIYMSITDRQFIISFLINTDKSVYVQKLMVESVFLQDGELLKIPS